jgi:multiple sugar transport system permease protein
MRSLDISITLDISVRSRPWSPRRLVPGVRQLIAWCLLAAAGIFFALPVVWLLLETTRTQADAADGSPLGFGSLGQVHLNWDVLTHTAGELGTWLGNSALYSGSGALIAAALGIPAGYGLATFEFAGRRPLLVATMLAMLIPSNALVLPLALEAHALHLLTSPLAVILPYGLFPFGVYIAYLYFNTPRIHGLVAAARSDGCSEWQAFRYVALPLSVPAVAIVVVLDFIASWTNYFLPWAMYWSYDVTGRFPVALGIAEQLAAGTTGGGYPLRNLELQTAAPPSIEALLILVSCAPVVAVVVIAQRWIGSGRLQGVFV